MQPKFLPINFPKAKKPQRIEDKPKAKRAKKQNTFPKGFRVKTGRPSILKTMPILPQRGEISKYKIY